MSQKFINSKVDEMTAKLEDVINGVLVVEIVVVNCI